MQKTTPRSLGFEVPRLGFGGMRFPLRTPGDEAAVDFEQVCQMVDYALGHGVNYFDTAYAYHTGLSEGIFGKALARHRREDYLLADKMPLWLCETEADVSRIFEEQLKRCATGYFDIYHLHAVDAARIEKVERLHIYEQLKREKERGRIRALGFSFHDTPACFRRFIDSYAFDVAQIQLNYLDWELQGAKELYEKLVEKDIAAIVMEPVRGGLLAALPADIAAPLAALGGGSQAAYALRWVAGLPGVAVVLSGMSSLEQMKENVATFSPPAPLSQAEEAAVDAVRQSLLSRLKVPCTGCKYCMDCPCGVPIPDQFGEYNKFHMFGDKAGYQKWYADREREGHSPAQCVACGQCAKKCPQHIDIPVRLAEVARAAAGL